MTKAELIGRLEAATADDAELMREVWLAVNPEPPRSWNPTPIQQAILDPELRPAIDRHTAWRRAKERFGYMLAAEAYESAALTLVPEGWDYVLYSRGEASVHRSDKGRRTFYDAISTTPALAIVTAALKARNIENASNSKAIPSE